MYLHVRRRCRRGWAKNQPLCKYNSIHYIAEEIM